MVVRPAIAAALVLALAGCDGEGSGDGVSANAAANAAAAPRTPQNPCSIQSTRDWEVAIDARPGSPRTLDVSGWVVLEERGSKPRLVAGPRDRAQPPTQQLRIAIERTGPGDPTGPAFFVSVVFPAEPEYQAVVIECGGVALARFEESDVRTYQ